MAFFTVDLLQSRHHTRCGFRGEISCLVCGLSFYVLIIIARIAYTIIDSERGGREKLTSGEWPLVAAVSLYSRALVALRHRTANNNKL